MPTIKKRTRPDYDNRIHGRDDYDNGYPGESQHSIDLRTRAFDALYDKMRSAEVKPAGAEPDVLYSAMSAAHSPRREKPEEKIAAAVTAQVVAALAGKGTPTAPAGTTPAPTTPAPADGRCEPFGFRWRAALVRDLAPLRYRLLLALWDREANRPHAGRFADEVMLSVWNDNNDNDVALKSLCRHVRTDIARLKLTIKSRGGKVWLEPLE